MFNIVTVVLKKIKKTTLIYTVLCIGAVLQAASDLATKESEPYNYFYEWACFEYSRVSQ